MKIRQGFVTNSSSTSFIISLKGDFKESNFLTGMGCDQVPWLKGILRELFSIVNSRKKDLLDAVKSSRCESIADYLSYFPDKPIKIVEKLLADNRQVYAGTLQDEGFGSEPVEAFFCAQSFLVDNDCIYFNGLQSRY